MGGGSKSLSAALCPTRPLDGLLVLVADDSPTHREIALEVLAELGCRASAVADGGDAVKALQQTDYDLVLMDCQMPVMDGPEATRHIRNPDSGVRNPRVPIIAVTANSAVGVREACLAAGMNAYLPKPLRVELLATLLDALAIGGKCHLSGDSKREKDQD
jgi:CheY-like chemotaxis protein